MTINWKASKTEAILNFRGKRTKEHKMEVSESLTCGTFTVKRRQTRISNKKFVESNRARSA